MKDGDTHLQEGLAQSGTRMQGWEYGGKMSSMDHVEGMMNMGDQRLFKVMNIIVVKNLILYSLAYGLFSVSLRKITLSFLHNRKILQFIIL